jgi:hypothetical protein
MRNKIYTVKCLYVKYFMSNAGAVLISLVERTSACHLKGPGLISGWGILLLAQWKQSPGTSLFPLSQSTAEVQTCRIRETLFIYIKKNLRIAGKYCDCRFADIQLQSNISLKSNLDHAVGSGFFKLRSCDRRHKNMYMPTSKKKRSAGTK